MSSFKKLRLDPELPASLRAQPGANDSGGRVFLDGSSFSSSTSGGSGAYGRSSSGPFRTRYSQPLGAPSPNSTSFSRFAPYYFGKERRASLRVPLIRARRDDSDSEGQRPSSRASLNSSIGGDSTASATSSTAQRIIETLQNLSTPVMNAGKIRIDQDIKAVQPLPFGGVSPLSRSSHGGVLNRSTGPPKMCSSLLLSNPSPANQTSPMFNPGDQRRLFCIPRMVDAATNTDKEEVSSPSQAIFSNKAVTPPANTKSQLTAAPNLKPVESTAPAKDDNSEEEFHECSSDFAFSNPWAPNVFDRFLASGKEDKSANKGPLGVQQRVINGYNKDTPTASAFGASPFSTKGISSFTGSTGTSPPFSLNSKSSPAPSFMGTGNTGAIGLGSSPLKESPFGKSPLNKPFESKSDAPKPLFGSGSAGSSAVTSDTNNQGGSAFTGFSFGKPASSPLKSAEAPKPFTFGTPLATKDSKPTGSLSTDKVDAPKTDSPVPAKSPFGGSSSSNAANNSTLPPLNSLTKPSTSKWRCPTCMVDNDISVAACVCCGEKNASSVAPKLATTNTEKKKWRCPTCMVENDLAAASCACCSEKNPNPSSAPPAVAPALSKKWRCPTCMVDNDLTVANCVCCSEKNPNPVSSKDSSAAGGTAPASTFKFGISSSVSSSTAPASSGSFVFGAPTQSDIQKPPVSGFQFGLASTTSSLTSISTTTPVSSSTLPTSSTSSATTTFKFGSAVQSSTPPAATFGFNASASTTSSAPVAVNTPTTTSSAMFSAPKVPESNSSSTGSAGLFGNSSFQTSQSTPTNNSFKFGSTSTSATNDAQKSSAPTTFSFGASAATKPAFNNFSFGDRPQNATSGLSGAATPSVLTPAPPAAAPMPAPTLGSAPNSFSFGASSPAPSPFGQLQPTNPSPSPGGLFAFGRGASSNPPPTSLTPSPAPSFSLTPNLNFGSTPGSSIPFGNPTLPTPNAGSQPPPALFQFNSTPSDSPAGRKIKKAVRRFNK